MKSLADSERENWKMTQQLDLWTCLIDHALTPKSVAGELNRIIHEWGELVESKLPMGQKHTARLRWLVLLLRVAVESTARMVGHIRIEDSIIRRLDMSEVVSFTINGMSSLLNRKRRPIEFGCSVDDDCLIMADRDVVQHVLRALLTYSLTHSGASPFTTNCRVCMTTDSEAVTITIETDTSHSFGPDSPDPFHYDPISQGDVRHAGDMRLLSCGRVLREVGGSICVAKSEKLTFECRWPCAQRPRKEGDT